MDEGIMILFRIFRADGGRTLDEKRRMKLKKDEPQLIPINWDKLWFIFFYDCLKFILNKNFHLVKYSQKAHQLQQKSLFQKYNYTHNKQYLDPDTLMKYL